ncbi:MAG TPA: MobF family relaxase, partial [Propionicimonas sp.]
AAATKALAADMTSEARAAAVETIMRVELDKDTGTAVAGFDLTFTVMKSVSTLWALGEPAVQQAIFDAHTAAVAQTMTLLEDRGLFTRTGAAGCRQETTRGAIAAAFDHWDSRAGDPNLHTHVVLANKVQTLDGRWISVDSRALHHALVAMSETYETFLVDELARRLPVRWGWRGRTRRAPALELDGVDDGLMVAFSQRASQIDEAMTDVISRFAAAHGRGPNRIEITRLRQQVTRATRPSKKIVPLGDLLARWRERAHEVSGLTPAELTARVMHESCTRPIHAMQLPAAVADELAGRVLVGVRERRSTWTRWNVLAEAARVTKALVAATPQDRLVILDAISDAVLARCVSLEAPEVLVATGRYARPEGGSVFDRPGEHAYTDSVILDAEQRLLAAASSGTAPTAPVPDEALTLPGNANGRLADDQAAAVRTIAGSGRLVDLLVGPAGSGKTTTLAALRRAWERQHGSGAVIGLAPSSTAAANLAGALGITCENTAKWLHESTGPGSTQRAVIVERLLAMRAATVPRDVGARRTIDTAVQGFRAHDARWTLRSGQLMVVDEASLAGTLALDELTRQAAHAGAKLLLVGDHAQLSAVDAGGAFGLLVDRTGGAQLRTLWRFTHSWEADATAALRAGNPRVLAIYEDAERVHAGPGESMLEDAYSAWIADVAAGYTAVLLAADAATVTALNIRAHNDRVQDGLVQPGGLTTSAGGAIGVGDRIVTRLNDRHLTRPGGFVRNGDLWDVQVIGADGSLTVVPAHTRLARRGVVGTPGSDEQTPMLLPGDYVQANVELAYATTTHRAQGITVDRAHVLAHAGMTRENLYVAMTRGRDANHVYVAVDTLDTDCDDLPDPHAALDARDLLATVLATTGAEQSATATIAAKQDEAASLRRLGPIARTLYTDAAQQRWSDTLAGLGVPAATVAAISQSPDAGRVFAALDRVAALAAPVRDTVFRGLIAGLDGHDEPAARLLAGAQRWLRRRVADAHDLPTVRNATGLDANGQALLDEVNQLLGDRVHALVGSALDEQPDWLGRLGPEPTNLSARQAWLDEIAATVAHHDRTATTPVVAAPATTPSFGR